MSNSTAFLGCSPFYSNFEENLKLFFQLVYLIPGFLLIIRMHYVIVFGDHDDYNENENFWTLYSCDLGFSCFNLLFDICYYRPSLFIPQICEVFSFFLRANPLLIHFTYPLWFYIHAGKMVIQSMISIERMTFNIMAPQDYKKLWKTLITVSILLIAFFPFTLIWNILISDKYIQYYYGGFQPNYARRVNWFGTTAWQLSYMQISMAITALSTIITLYKILDSHTPRRKLCTIWCAISVEYFIMGLVFCFFHMKSFGFEYSNLIFILVFFIWDGFNILNPLIMVIMNKSLRRHVFKLREVDEERK
ncbi:hypothetical protein CAEBREN_32590 [Caenorhabditis brenneri]|uniref:Serpentine receptor class gamma n=1 Tax=Caenorhabditis brenneri TaxID=135651 RepID=G0N2T0_CAEBE|nr:hypothetical protein CAEBREN_32590 [Caenorhabditis brenneri]